MGENLSKPGGEGKKHDQAPAEPSRSGAGRLGGRGDRPEGTGIEPTSDAASAHPFAYTMTGSVS